MKKLVIILFLLPTLSFAKVVLPWERIMDPTNNWATVKMYRMPVPHGWLVYTGQTSIFVPDENHEWTLEPAKIPFQK